MGMITIDEVEVWVLSSPPNVGPGQVAPVGSLAFVLGDGIWHKIDTADTDWVSIPVNNASGKIELSDIETITPADVGLGNVDDVQQMPLSYLDTDTALTANSDAKVSSQKAIKAYVDTLIAAAVAGFQLKSSCRAISTSNIASLSGLAQTIDGVAIDTDGYRVLLNGQSTGSQNGIWVAHSGAWTRPDDFDTGDHAHSSFVIIEQGTANADKGFVCTTDSPNDVIGTDSLSFSPFSGAGGGTWGSITGTLSDQTDLQTALDAKVDVAGDTMTGDLIGTDFIKTRSGSISRTGDYISSVAKTSGRTITVTRDGNGYITSATDGTRTWTFTRTGNQITSWTVT